MQFNGLRFCVYFTQGYEAIMYLSHSNLDCVIFTKIPADPRFLKAKQC